LEPVRQTGADADPVDWTVQGVVVRRGCGDAAEAKGAVLMLTIRYQYRVLGTVLLLAVFLVLPAAGDTAERKHGLSIFGELKYPPDFKHFDYVNPNAPKGGRLVKIGTSALAPFNSFNSFILRGDYPQGIGIIYDSLMTRALDEPDTVYGLVAHSVAVAEDKSSATFYMRPEARFSDGSPLTAEDVVFTLISLKEKGAPAYRFVLQDVSKAEALDPHTVRFSFTGPRTRDLPLLVAGLPIISKKYYTTPREDGVIVKFEETSLRPPVTSGPYRVGKWYQGRYVIYERRPDYWGKDLPVNVGQNNFDQIRYDYYLNRNIELDALFSGLIDLREDFTSRDWATAYDVPAVRQKRLLRYQQPDHNPSGTQGFFINTRREKFKDVRVREALDLVFDFEWMNRNLFFSLYTRTKSYFENSDMKAVGPPSPEELSILEPFRDKLPKEVFDPPYSPPVNDGFNLSRDNLRRASELLDAAGWKLVDGRRVKTVNGREETLTIEFMIESPTSERIIIPYQTNLNKLGIVTVLRQVDPAQYQNRTKSYDYDLRGARFVLSLTPGPELRNFWGSEASKREGGFNLAGINDPVVDALIDKVTMAKSRAELNAVCRALDRVLRAGHYWVPNWYKASFNIAYWDKYSRPPNPPRYDSSHASIIATWWYDPEKAKRLVNTN
jgi:microcin C transport system substrate-binding protein